MSGGVFICYRREDSAGFAGRIYDRLRNSLGRESVFIDVDNIPAGRDFVEVLSKRVGRCDALIAVIGRNWLASADKDNRRRLDDPNDFVRIEIEAALNRNVPVIPVLVDGAAMPDAGDLPDALKKLARRQGIEISHTRFDSDVDRLARALSLPEGELSERDKQRGSRQPAAEAERVRKEEESKNASEIAGKAEVPPKKSSFGWTEVLSGVLGALADSQKQRVRGPVAPTDAPTGLSLAGAIPGWWHLQIMYPNGATGEATALFEPGGNFSAEGRGLAAFRIQGTWRADNADQVSLRGQQFDGVRTTPYYAVVGFSSISSVALVGTLNTGEQTVWRRQR